MGTQLVVASHNNSSTLIVAQATTAGKKKNLLSHTWHVSRSHVSVKSAPVLETALAVGAYAEENRMGGGARGQEKKTEEPAPLASLGSRRLEPGAGWVRSGME